jgi:hypothetical protein
MLRQREGEHDGEVVVAWFQAIAGCLSEGTNKARKNLVSAEDLLQGQNLNFETSDY